MPATGPAALDRPPRRRRAVLLAAPWAVALALVVAALVLRPQAAAPSVPDAAGRMDSLEDDPTDGPSAAARGTAVPSTTVRPGTVAPATLPAGTHIQVLAHARAALGTAGLATDGPGPTDRWPVEVRIAEVTEVTDTLAIAIVHALVIEVTDTGWTGPVLRAAAVPLLTSPEVRVAGPGWPVAGPSLSVATVEGEAVEEPDPAMLTPLERAGWDVDEVVAVDLLGGAVLQVALTGAPPDGGGHGHHVVWLLDAPGGPRLLPLDAPTTAPDTQHPEDAQHAQDLQEST